jgi:cobalamin biosynthesis Mg chelatase CobN
MLINLILNKNNSVIIEISKNASILQLKKKLSSIINVDYSNIDIYKTKDMDKSMQTISKFLLKNNDIIIYNIIKNNRKNYLGYKLKYSQNNNNNNNNNKSKIKKNPRISSYNKSSKHVRPGSALRTYEWDNVQARKSSKNVRPGSALRPYEWDKSPIKSRKICSMERSAIPSYNFSNRSPPVNGLLGDDGAMPEYDSW